MKSIAKLKDQARTHEQREEWEKAIAAYREILRLGEELEGDAELPLFNKVGDLYLRLGRSDEAVEQYEQAADRYADAGLYNNAIALCNKALRYAPGHVEVYRRLGRFCAAQGFFADARRWILEYAEKVSAAGSLEQAFEALEEFAELTRDPEIAEMLAARLHAHGSIDEAVLQLRSAHRLYAEAGRHDRAEAVRATLAEIAPDASVDDVLAAPAGRDVPDHDEEEEAYSPGAFGELEIQTTADAAGIPAAETEPEPLPLFDTEAGPEPFESVSDSDAAHEPADEAEASLDGFGMVDIELESAADAAGLGEPVESTGPEPAEEFGALDLEDATLPDAEPLLESDAEESEPLPLLDTEDDEAEPLPLLDFGGDTEDVGLAAQDEAEAEPLPLLDEEAAGAEPLPFSEEEAVDAAPAPELDVEAVRIRAREALARADKAGAVRELEPLHSALAELGRLREAIDVVAELAVIEPGRIRHRQQKVEYAVQLGDTPMLVAAYLDLAGVLEDRGAATQARAVLQRVLDLDPANETARAALYGGAPARAKEYVDLTAFLGVETEAPRESTRFVVAEQARSGDEDQDFAAMLTQFRAKVADNVGVEDTSSHYDLGLAFKEMGLVDEAIDEFQTALRGGEERLKVYEELGHCFILKGQYTMAVKVLARALQLPRDEDAELLGVYYHLGRCYEELGQRGEARDAYARVAGLVVDFRDVPERLARL